VAPAETTTSREIAVHFRGTAERESSAANRFVYTTDLYSVATGERIGSATNNFSPQGPFVNDFVITFHLPDGDIVAHDLFSIPPDPQHPGFFIAAAHSKGNDVLSDRGTGLYAGRPGSIGMWGYHDGTKFPEQVTFNDFYVIELK
jgi:hypothetical protein